MITTRAVARGQACLLGGLQVAGGGDWNIGWVAETQGLHVQLHSQAHHNYRRKSFT